MVFRLVESGLRDLAIREAADVARSRERAITMSNYRSRAFVPYEYARSKILTVHTFLPEAVAYNARRKVYAYPLPLQRQLRGRVIRKPLKELRTKYVPAKVRIRVPEKLPLARASYVSIRRNNLNVHSRNQTARLFDVGELNRRRYQEFKGNSRRAGYGQLDSPGSTAFGIVAHTARRTRDIAKIADAALVARAVLKGW